MKPLRVWFVNVGHGDCTIVQFPENPYRIMMVDICNSKSLDKNSKSELLKEAGWTDNFMRKWYISAGMGHIPEQVLTEMSKYEDLLDDPIDLFESIFSEKSIFRFVLTHPDMDHMAGMHRLFEQEGSINVVNFWDTENNKPDPDKTGSYYDPKDWEAYKKIRKTNTESPKVIHLYSEAKGKFYAEDGINILSPTKLLVDECNNSGDWNNLSQVLCIDYGKSSVLLPGDVEEKAQKQMVDKYGKNLKSTILKAPHHGRESGFYKEFVENVNPDYTIVSTGKKECDASDKYRRYTNKKVFSTRFMGTIYAELYPNGKIYLYNSSQKGNERIDEEGRAVLRLRNKAIMASRRNHGLGLG